MNGIRNKKGSHVGVVVSFVIFVTFLLFLYSILQPVTFREKDKDYILEYLTLNLLGEATGNMTSLIIHIEGPIPKTCVQLQNVPEEEIPPEVWHNLVFKDPENDEILDYYIKQNKIYVYCGLSFDGMLKVHYSDNTVGQENNDREKDCFPHETSIGYVKAFSEIFGEKIYDLNESYYLEYEGLKALLGLPEGTEFNFYVLDGLRNPIISAEIYDTPTDRSVYVEETPIQYLNEDGNMIFGFLLVKVW